MRLTEFVERYLESCNVSAGYEHQLRTAIRLFEKAIGPIDVEKLTEDLVNQHLRQMRNAGLSDSYIAGRRRNLLVVWNAAADRDLIAPPRRRRLMRVRVNDRIIRSWSIDEVRRLIQATDALQGKFPKVGISRRLYWRSYVMAAWDTGLRGCDLRSLERDWIPPIRTLTIVQSKTGKRKRVALHRSTMECLDASFPPKRRLCWPLWGSAEAWRKSARNLISKAGLRGSLKYLRSGAGTTVDLRSETVGRGHDFLGNTRAVFEKHYRDPELAQEAPLIPPPLVE